MNEKHPIIKSDSRNRLFFSVEKRKPLLTDREKKYFGVLAVATVVALGLTGYHSLQNKNDNLIGADRQATLTFGPNSSNWSASELMAEAEGLNPHDKSNYNIIENLETDLVNQEANNSVAPTSGEKFKNIYVPVDTAHQNIAQMSGFGVKLKFDK